MRESHRTVRIAVALAVVVGLAGVVIAAEAYRDEAMIQCVEGGGIYHDDGRCEGGSAGDPPPAPAEPDAKNDPGVQYGEPDDAQNEARNDAQTAEEAEEAARKACRRKGGRYRDGNCELSGDPIKRCQDSGGLFMVDGRCFRPEY